MTTEQLVAVRYVGPKARKSDNVAGTGTVWIGHGDVQDVPASAWPKLAAYPDVWRLAGDTTPLPDASPVPGMAALLGSQLDMGIPGLSLEQYLRQEALTGSRHFTIETRDVGQDVVFLIRPEGNDAEPTAFLAIGHYVLEAQATVLPKPPQPTSADPNERPPARWVLTHRDGNVVELDRMTKPELKAFVKENGIEGVDLRKNGDELKGAIYLACVGPDQVPDPEASPPDSLASLTPNQE